MRKNLIIKVAAIGTMAMLFSITATIAASTITAEATASADTGTRLQAPLIKGFKSGVMEWSNVKGATAYRVYEKTTEGWTPVGQTAGCEMDLSNWKRDRVYSVQAISGNEKSAYDKAFSYKYHRYGRDKVIFEGASTVAPRYSWARRTARMMGFKSINRAKPGAVVSIRPRKSMYMDALRKGYKGCNLVVITPGANDYSSGLVRLGRIKSRDPRTYCGALNGMLKIIHRDAPKARIIIMTQREFIIDGQYAYDRKNEKGDTLRDYERATINIARRHPHCYIMDTSSAKVVTRKNIEKTTIDLRHPNAAAHRKFSDTMVKYLNDEVMNGNDNTGATQAAGNEISEN
jgi:lysophospholipase L1-like esterase